MAYPLFSNLRWRRILITLGIIVVLLVSVAFIAVHFFLSPYVKERLIGMVNRESKGLYTLNINTLSINLWNSSVSAAGVSLRCDSAKWEMLRRDTSRREALPLKLKLDIPMLSVTGIGWWGYWQYKHISLGTINIQSPRINLVILKDSIDRKDRVEDTVSKSLPRRLPDIISPLTTRLQVKQLLVHNAALRYEGANPQGRMYQQMDSINFRLSHLLIDKGTASTGTKLLYSENMEISFRNYQLVTPDSLYKLSLGIVALTSADSTLKVERLQLVPLVSDAEFSRRKVYRKSRYKLKLKSIEVQPLDLYRLFHHNEWVASSLVANEVHFDVRTDKNMPKEPDERKKMPHELVRALSFYLRLDTVWVKKSIIAYTEEVPDGKGVGTIKFTNMDIKVYNLTNDSTRMTGKTPARMVASAYLMGTGLLRLQLSYPLLAREFNCSYAGTLGTMKASYMNAMFTPNEHLRIEDGVVEKVGFDVKVQNGVAFGTLQATYRDLKVEVLDKKTHEKKNLLSAIANLVIKDKNKPNDEVLPFKEGQIAYTRTPKDSFVRFLWRTMKTGLYATITPVPLKAKFED